MSRSKKNAPKTMNDNVFKEMLEEIRKMRECLSAMEGTVIRSATPVKDDCDGGLGGLRPF